MQICGQSAIAGGLPLLRSGAVELWATVRWAGVGICPEWRPWVSICGRVQRSSSHGFEDIVKVIGGRWAIIDKKYNEGGYLWVLTNDKANKNALKQELSKMDGWICKTDKTYKTNLLDGHWCFAFQSKTNWCCLFLHKVQATLPSKQGSQYPLSSHIKRENLLTCWTLQGTISDSQRI